MNETIINEVGKLTFEQVIEVTMNPIMILGFIVIWLVPLIIYLIVGSLVRARTSTGQKMKVLMIQSRNFWIGFFIWFLVQPILFLLFVIFPFWLKFI